MAVLPAERDLQHEMKIVEADGDRHFDAADHRRRHFVDLDAQTRDLGHSSLTTHRGHEIGRRTPDESDLRRQVRQRLDTPIAGRVCYSAACWNVSMSSRGSRSTILPSLITHERCLPPCNTVMSAMGSLLSTIRSASLPGASSPTWPSRPTAKALSRVAATMASIGV